MVVENFYADIEEALDRSCKKQFPVNKNYGYEWYTAELADRKSKVRRIKNYVKKALARDINANNVPRFSEEDWRKARNKYRSGCRKARKAQYQESIKYL